MATQTAPPRPPTPAAAATQQLFGASICEPYRDYIEAQLRLKRNAMSIYQDLVDQFGFTGAYNAVKRFTAKLRWRAPEQFDRLEFAPGEHQSQLLRHIAILKFVDAELARLDGHRRDHEDAAVVKLALRFTALAQPHQVRLVEA